MNSTIPVEDVPPVDKGKRRAQDPTERTPLLGAHSSSSVLDDPPAPAVVRRRLLSKLARIFLVSLIVSVLAAGVLGLLAWSYASRASHVSADDILNNGLVFEGPDRVDVLNITWSGGIWVNVEARVGFDAGSVIGVNASPDGDGLFRDVWKALGRWGVRRLDRVSVNMTAISLTSQSGAVLATIEPTPVVVPLTANPPSDSSWLTHISTPLLIRPTSNTSALIQFVREAWRDGSAAVKADVGHVDVRGGALSESSWRNILHSELSNIRTALRIQIPPIPGIPHTGPAPSLSKLITLRSFNVRSAFGSLDLTACATLPDPAPTTFNLTSPSLPFIISLPSPGDADPLPIASVATAPFTLTHPNITLDIAGTVLPLPAPAAPSSPPSSRATSPASPTPSSGTVYARVVLPRGMHVGLHVARVLPDVLVFDGPVPDDAVYVPVAAGDPTSPPLPDPLPERAFGHIRPADWLASLSGPVPSEDGEGAAFAVTAKIVDVPLEVLPGRQKEFSNFVSKVIFGSDGAVAGLLGTASVAVEVFGLPFPGGDGGEMELNGLPFRGSVPVGKKGLLGAGVGGVVEHTRDELRRLRDRFLHRGKESERERTGAVEG
ncbi:hypothetical protein B0H17DRAFT_1047135 [Mycena rosella]|uniref:Uncharacterized protein n=1 Tax=Mycena rosella TaxID=1033263 RepID=A0AAD7GP53_MYCRO|nr:hypothetical protein B0H17DRAFT_1047135 [Mycena rosella]